MNSIFGDDTLFEVFRSKETSHYASKDHFDTDGSHLAGDVCGSYLLENPDHDQLSCTTSLVELQEKSRCLCDKVKTKVGEDDIATVIFYNNRKHSRHARLFFEQYISSKVLDISKKPNNETKREICVPTEISEATTVLGSCTYNENFIIDSCGWPFIQHLPNPIPGWILPKYKLEYDQVFGDSKNINKIGSIAEKRQRLAPVHLNKVWTKHMHSNSFKNTKKMNQTKKKSEPALLPSIFPVQRYHEDKKDLKYLKLKAGVLSDKLKEALGIEENELPPYIYRMRVFGYPPGHLETARNSRPGLTMFGKHGMEMGEDGELLEEGELVYEKSKQLNYNIEKIIEYPGFNVLPPSHIKDKHMQFHSPPMQPYHSKVFMVDYLNNKHEEPNTGFEEPIKNQHAQFSENITKNRIPSERDAFDHSEICISSLSRCDSNDGGKSCNLINHTCSTGNTNYFGNLQKNIPSTNVNEEDVLDEDEKYMIISDEVYIVLDETYDLDCTHVSTKKGHVFF